MHTRTHARTLSLFLSFSHARTHASTHTYTRAHTQTHTHTHAHTLSRTHARTHARTHTHTHTHTHLLPPHPPPPPPHLPPPPPPPVHTSILTKLNLHNLKRASSSLEIGTGISFQVGYPVDTPTDLRWMKTAARNGETWQVYRFGKRHVFRLHWMSPFLHSGCSRQTGWQVHLQKLKS